MCFLPFLSFYNVHYGRKEQIKRAAPKVFARRGIDGNKMSMIAAEAETIYNS